MDCCVVDQGFVGVYVGDVDCFVGGEVVGVVEYQVDCCYGGIEGVFVQCGVMVDQVDLWIQCVQLVYC